MSAIEKFTSKMGSGIGWKLIYILVLVILLSIVTFSIKCFINDRIKYKTKVLSDIGIQWGSPKTILGPVLRIPYFETVKIINADGKPSFDLQQKFIYVFPQELTAKINLKNKELYRGIYKENVYNSEIELFGKFSLSQADIKSILEKPNLKLNKTSVLFAINETKSFKSNLVFSFNEFTELNLNQSTQNGLFYELSSSEDFINSVNDLNRLSDFRMAFNLNGSRKFELIPSAKELKVEMSSNWPHPSFSGAYVPETRSITNNGFQAEWKIFSILNSYETLVNNSFQPYSNPYDENIIISENSSSFGVELYSPISIYTKVDRSLKYGFVFILLTFSMYFLIEVIFKQRFHQIQYLMIGLAISIFYLLLLSLSEHIGFDLAYLIAALGVTSLIGFYTRTIFDKQIISLLTTTLIALLYAYLYLLLQLTDYSLLLGSIGLFAVLSAIMLVSRKIDWYEI